MGSSSPIFFLSGDYSQFTQFLKRSLDDIMDITGLTREEIESITGAD